MNKTFRNFIFLLLGLFATKAAWAHHSPAAFDITKEIFIAGTISEMRWANPHIYLAINTSDADNAPTNIVVEVSPITTVQTTGLKKEHLAFGSMVTVRANPNRKKNSNTVLGLDIALQDGSIYPLNPSGRTSAAKVPTVLAASIAGKWASTPEAFTALIRKTPTYPLTDNAKAQLADSHSYAVYQASCYESVPPMLTTIPSLREILVSNDFVTIRFDSLGLVVERIICLNTKHPKNIQPSVQGHSIGIWKKNTLEIDTVGFLPNRQGVGFGVPSGPGKHFIERLTLTEDRLHLQYDFTMEDPEFLLAPVSYSSIWDHRPDLEYSNSECDMETAVKFLQD